MVNPFTLKMLNSTLAKYMPNESTTSVKCTADNILAYDGAVKCKAVTPLNDAKKLCIDNGKGK